jgi:2,3-diketo-5-methylthio-1-phosphopentane phosphatase
VSALDDMTNARLFIVDFDGTIAVGDTVDRLLERFADPSWRAIEDAWVAGRINSRDCMRAQLALVTAERPQLEEFFRAVDIDPSFAEFVHCASALGQVAVVSDGLDHPIRLALERRAVAPVPVFANRLEFSTAGLDLSFPHAHATCTPQSGVCKCAVARSLDAGRGLQTVLIGDGRSDLCIARSADYVFAKDSLLRYCQTEGIAHTPFTSFRDVLAVIQGWDTVSPNPIAREPSCQMSMS